MFLSDVPAELHAAAAAGWQTVGVARDGEPFGDADFGPHRTVSVVRRLEITPREPSDQQLADEAARYAAMGWMRGTSGNLSVVLARDPLRLAVTASGLDKGELTARDHVEIDDDGTPVAGGSAVRGSRAARADRRRSPVPARSCTSTRWPRSSPRNAGRAAFRCTTWRCSRASAAPRTTTSSPSR